MHSPLTALQRCISSLNVCTTQHSASPILQTCRSTLTQPPPQALSLPSYGPYSPQAPLPLPEGEATPAEPPPPDVVVPPTPASPPTPTTPAPSDAAPHTPAKNAWRYYYPTNHSQGSTNRSTTTSTGSRSTTSTGRSLRPDAGRGPCGSGSWVPSVAGGRGVMGRCKFESSTSHNIGSSRTGSIRTYYTGSTHSCGDGNSGSSSSNNRGSSDGSRGHSSSSSGGAGGGAGGRRREGDGGAGGGSGRFGRGSGVDGPLPFQLPVTAGSHYDVLGVPRTAPLTAIKSAFRQRAKRLHPDTFAATHGTTSAPHPSRPPLPHPDHETNVAASASAFLRLVTAYEVLSNPVARREYDMRLSEAEAAATSSSSSGVSGGGAHGHPTGRWRAAPAAHGNASATSGDGVGGDIDFRSWRYGVGEWMTRPRREPLVGRRAVLEHYLRKYSSEFESQLHAALVHAYLGPKLDLQPGELPRCFEGELRRTTGASEQLMHLVSGRSLLGMVKVKEPLQLPPPPPPGAAATSCNQVQPGQFAPPQQLTPPPQSQPPPPQSAASTTSTAASTTSTAALIASTAASAATNGPTTTLPPARGANGDQQDGPAAPTPLVLRTPHSVRQPVTTHTPSAAWADEVPVVAAGAGSAATTASTTAGSGAGLYHPTDEGYSVGKHDNETTFTTPTTDTNPVARGPIAAAAASTAAAVDAATLAEVLPPAVTDAGSIDPLDALDASVVCGLSDEAIVQLAAASIARRDVSASGYGHLVPGYSRFRGLLELQGFYPDPAALQRHSMQISLVTAAEAAQAREIGGSLGGARLMDRWQRGEAEAVTATAAEAAAGARTGGDDGLGGGGDGGGGGGRSAFDSGREGSALGGVGGPSLAEGAAAAAAGEEAGEGPTAVYDERVVQEVLPPPQLQGLMEATREALHQEEAPAATAAAVSTSSSTTTTPPRNDPRSWRFGPDGTGDNDVNGPPLTVLELRIGGELTAVALHQPPPQPQPQPTAAATAAAAATVVTAASAAAADIIGEVRQRLRGGVGAEGGGGGGCPGRGGGGGGSGSSGTGGTGSGSQSHSDPPLEGTMVPLFGPVVEGRVKVYVGGRLAAGVEGRHVYDAEGKRVALIVRGSFPGLRTIHFFDATTRRLRLTCRCVRANLLPSPTWIFPPREETHDVGGWYFEWGGYGRRGQPGWLDPCVYVFVSALVAAEQERVAAGRRAAVGELVGGWGRAVRRLVAEWWGR